MPSPTVEIADGRFTMRNGEWSMTEPVERLPFWLTFYRGLANRPGRAEFYGPSVTAIERAMRAAGIHVPAYLAHQTRKK